MNINVTVEDSAWNGALDELIVLCREQGKAASLEAAQEIRDEARALLTSVWHAPNTKTPSPKGAPPAAITGTLATSVEAEEVGDEAWVGPTRLSSSPNGPTGRFLELGGTHEAHNPSGAMHWFENGEWHHAAAVTKEARPSLEPATETVIDSGKLTEIYVSHWTDAIEEVTA